MGIKVYLLFLHDLKDRGGILEGVLRVSIEKGSDVQ